MTPNSDGTAATRSEGGKSCASTISHKGSVTHVQNAAAASGHGKVVGYHDQCASLSTQAVHQSKHFFACLGVKRARRFVSQNQRGICDECPGDGDPLLLPSRQLSWFPLQKPIHPHGRQGLADSFGPAGPDGAI